MPQNLAEPSVLGEAAIGHFRTAPADSRSVSFVWSGDTAGQGWGINEAWGGMKAYATMLKHDPDFFIHSGDTIYADGIIPAEVKLKDGTIWKNVVTEAKSKVAQTLDDFRGNFQYNLLDKNVRAFNAQVPMFAQWDDHEVTNNWWPEEPLTRAEHTRKKYNDKFALPLVARSHRAFHEYMPIRRMRLSLIGSIARSAMGRWWTCSCWMSGAIAVRTATTGKPLMARTRISWDRCSSPG